MSDSLSSDLLGFVVCAGHDVRGECEGILDATGLKLCSRLGSGLESRLSCGDDVLVNRGVEYNVFGGLSGKNPAPGIGATSGNGRCGVANRFACGVGIPFIPFCKIC